MKKRKIWLILSFSIASLNSSISFFRPRQITTDSTYELALTNYHIFNHNSYKNSQFYIKPFYQRSNNVHEVAQYFLPNNQSCAQIREDGTGDINSLWFNLISPAGTFYSSTLCFSPTKSIYGAMFNFFTNFKDNSNFWLLITSAIVKTKNNLGVKEFCLDNFGTINCNQNFCEVFKNIEWQFGKISCHELTKHGLDDIQVKLGYKFNCYENYNSLYGVLTIPTGCGSTSKFLFEPLVGSNQASLGLGLNYGINLPCSKYNIYKNISILGDLKYRYVFSGTETRSFDLRNNGNWSRYLLVVEENFPLYSRPGINYFTIPVNVTPRSTIDFWTALHCNYCDFNLELGYNFWWRQKEKICLNTKSYSYNCLNNSSNNIGIYDMPGVCNIARSSSGSRINQSILGPNPVQSDPVFIPVRLSDLNLNSAAHPETSTNKIYMALDYQNNYFSNPVNIGLGASYEISRKISAFSNGAVWGILSIYF